MSILSHSSTCQCPHSRFGHWVSSRPRELSSHIWRMPVSSASFDGEERKISLRSKKAVVRAEASLVGLLAPRVARSAASTSSMITTGTGLEESPAIELAPTRLRKPPGYLFFLIEERLAVSGP